MINISAVEMELDCPRCKFKNPFTIKQAEQRVLIICRGCHCNIRLDDSVNTVRNAMRSIDRAMRDLHDTLKSIGTITIRF